MTEELKLEEQIEIPEEEPIIDGSKTVKRGKGYRLMPDKKTAYKTYVQKKNEELYERLPVLISEQLWQFQQEKERKKEERKANKEKMADLERERAEFEEFKNLKKIKEAGGCSTEIAKEVVDKIVAKPKKALKKCEHCNNEYTAKNILAHQARCYHNPNKTSTKKAVEKIDSPAPEVVTDKPTINFRHNGSDSIW